MARARHDVPPANTGTGSRLITYEGEAIVNATNKKDAAPCPYHDDDWKPRKKPQAAVEDARAELAAAEAALADKTAREALSDRIDADCRLAAATISLLHEVARLRVHGLEPRCSDVLAKYRKELSALAESYGVRIVLVGDKTAAMLVLA